MSKREATNPEVGNVLVVDDDEQAVDIIARLLSLRGYATLRATSGAEGLEVARAKHVDVILLDVMMPGLDGIEVCVELAKDEATREIPVILLTGKDDFETRGAAMKLGVSEFLAKPVNKADLYARVAAQVRAHRQLTAADPDLDET